MKPAIYYNIILDDDIIAEEEYELKETASLFGIKLVSMDDLGLISVVFGEEEEPMREKVLMIGGWMGRIGLDSNIITIQKVEEYHTNYVNEEIISLSTQATKGSC